MPISRSNWDVVWETKEGPESPGRKIARIAEVVSKVSRPR